MKKIFVILFTGFFLAGCAMGPDYQQPPAPEYPVHRGPGAVGEKQSLADVKWFELFQDPQLQGLIRTALEKNEDLQIAAARVLEAQASYGIARSDLFPHINGVGAADWSRYSRNSYPSGPADREDDNYTAGLDLNWEIDLWGKLRRLNEAARAEYLSQEWARQGVQISLIAAVAQTYFEMRTMDQEMEISRRTKESREKSVKLTRVRLDMGVSTRLEVRQAENLLYTATARIPELESGIVQRENRISVLLAQPPSDIPRGLPLTGHALPVEIPAGLPSDLLTRRPDIQAAEQRLIAANARIGAARALYFPQISLTGFLGVQTSDLDDFITSDSTAWNIAGNVLQPIFNAGQISSLNEQAKAQYMGILADYRKTVLAAFQDVSDSLTGYQKARESRAEQEKLVVSLRDNANLAYKRFMGGLDSYLQVLDAERSLYDAELNLAQIQGQELLYLVRVYKALGGGWEVPAQTASN
jgi:multidrug efflux system outer membrane protein